jgi:amino acid permease
MIKKCFTQGIPAWAGPCSRNLILRSARREKTQRAYWARPMSGWPVFYFSFSFSVFIFSTLNNLGLQKNSKIKKEENFEIIF